MAQTGVTEAPGRVEAIQADGCGVGSDVRDSAIRSKYEAVRSATSTLAASMSAEDQMVQSCPEASPVKWHQAHTTWFFETFVLCPFLKDYKTPAGRVSLAFQQLLQRARPEDSGEEPALGLLTAFA